MSSHDDQSIADALKAAIGDAQDLVRSEITLAKAELRQEVNRVGAGVAALVAGAVAALVGLVFVLTAIAWAISEGLGWPAWSGFLLVAVVVALAAVALVAMGRRRISSERHMPLTVDTFKETMRWMRARTS